MAHVDKNFLKSRAWLENADGTWTNGRPFQFRDPADAMRHHVVPAGIIRDADSAAALEANRPPEATAEKG